MTEESGFEIDLSDTESFKSCSSLLSELDHEDEKVAVPNHIREDGPIFSNDLVLRNIFKFLPFPDLKSMRLVNRQWNIEATKILMRDFITKSLEITKTSVQLHSKTSSIKNSRITLKEFSKLVQHSSQFPSQSFRISSKFQLMPEDREILNFFQNHGHIIKSFKIFSTAVTHENKNTIENILTELLPNLENLTIVGHMNQILCSDSENLQLKKLKNLDLKFGSHTIYQLGIPQHRNDLENIGFPLGVSLARTFPSLKSVTLLIDNSRVVHDDPRKLFSWPQNPVLTVESLVLAQDTTILPQCISLSAANVEFFNQIFPNLISADFGFLEDFKSASVFLWKMKCLEDLKFEILLKHGEVPFPKYDAVLTGLSEESVERLYTTPQRELNRMTEDDIKALRLHSAISDLQRLKHLRMSFVDRRGRRKITLSCGVDPGNPEESLKYQVENNIILSHVAGRFGFRMCQELRSNVHIALSLPAFSATMIPQLYDPQHTFRTIAPFVQPIEVTGFASNSHSKFLVVDDYLRYKLDEVC